jgi:hypothetical protein
MVSREETGFRNRPLPTFGAASRIQGRCFLMATEWHGRAEPLAQNGKLACGMRGRGPEQIPASIERKVPPIAMPGPSFRHTRLIFRLGAKIIVERLLRP